MEKDEAQKKADARNEEALQKYCPFNKEFCDIECAIFQKSVARRTSFDPTTGKERWAIGWAGCSFLSIALDLENM